jgi:hypothetical protein
MRLCYHQISFTIRLIYLRSKEYKDVAKARAEYHVLRGDKLSQHRHRKFVFGAIYEILFPGFLEIDPFMADYDVAIRLATGKESELKVRLVSPDDGLGKVNLLSAIVELGRSLSGPGMHVEKAWGIWGLCMKLA